MKPEISLAENELNKKVCNPRFLLSITIQNSLAHFVQHKHFRLYNE